MNRQLRELDGIRHCSDREEVQWSLEVFHVMESNCISQDFLLDDPKKTDDRSSNEHSYVWRNRTVERSMFSHCKTMDLLNYWLVVEDQRESRVRRWTNEVDRNPDCSKREIFWKFWGKTWRRNSLRVEQGSSMLYSIVEVKIVWHSFSRPDSDRSEKENGNVIRKVRKWLLWSFLLLWLKVVSVVQLHLTAKEIFPNLFIVASVGIFIYIR